MTADSYLVPNTSGTGYVEKTGVQISGGVSNAGNLVAYDSNGQVNAANLPGAFTANASEGISGPAACNTFDSGGTDKVRNADYSTSGKECNGFVVGTLTTGDPATVLMGKGTIISGFTGLTDGGYVYLAASGAVTQTPPAQGSGKTWQVLGKAISATQILLDIQAPVQR